MAVQRINPASLEQSPYYSQATLVPPGASMLYIGGQNAVTAAGAWIGLGDEAALKAAGAHGVAGIPAFWQS